YSAAPNRWPRHKAAVAAHRRIATAGGGWSTPRLLQRLASDVPSGCDVRGPDTQGSQAIRSTCPGPHHIRPYHQRQDRQCHQRHDATVNARAGEPGHRVTATPHWLVTCSCSWGREASSDWAANAVSRLQRL